MIFLLITLLVIVLVFTAVVFNSLVSLKNKVKEAFSTMDVFLKKRSELIPVLSAAVKGYADHETATLEKLTKIRAQGGVGLAETITNESQIGDAVDKLLVSVEKYPDLKANENFLSLQKEMVKVEEDIAHSRRYYNGSVREYNNKCQMVPYNILAMIFGFKPMPMYEVKSQDERNVVEVKL